MNSTWSLSRGHEPPRTSSLGVMVEVPSLLWQLDEIASAADFLSVGSNDLMQYLYAVDRDNRRVADRFDPLSVGFLRALRSIAQAGERHGTPVTLCGEMGGQTLEAMALMAIGYRELSMSATSIGPVKAMTLSLNVGEAEREVEAMLAKGREDASLRKPLQRLAERLRCASSDASVLNPRRFRFLSSHMAANDNLDLILRRHQEISARLAEGAAGAQYSALSRELNELEPVVAAIEAFQSKEKERADLAAMLREPKLDPDMRAMAEAELAAVDTDAEAMSKAIQIALLPKDAADEGSAIIEVRAGTGGDEAALFAGDLFRMYVKYAERKRWKVEVLSSSEGTAGGFKEIVAEVSGRGVFARFKFESGVHRVQRVPATETQGRIHTSAATVAIMPIPEEADFVINEADLKVDTMRSSGAGGQHVNKTELAIRITHLPTGVVVAMQEERSQHRNRAKAMALLRSRILDAKNQKLDAERAQERRSQVGSGDRSQRIRTYNFPQGRLTDHRVNLTLYSLDRIMEGEGLDEIIDGLTAERQAELLAAQAASVTPVPRLPAIRAGNAHWPPRRVVQSAARGACAHHAACAAPARARPRLVAGDARQSTEVADWTGGAQRPHRGRAQARRRASRRGHRRRGSDRLPLHL